MVFRNERSLYKRKCDATGKEIISIYSPDTPFKVYDQKYWWSDKWEPMEYGKNYDWNKSFFEQFEELSIQFPRQNLYQKNCIDSPWTNREYDSKNCYLDIAGFKNEDCAYNVYANWCNKSFDNYGILKSELCYNNFLGIHLYKVFFSKFCFDCQELYFSENCVNCSNLLGCINLRNKNYYIFNKPVTKEKFQQTISQLGNFSFIEKVKQDFEKNKKHKYL